MALSLKVILQIDLEGNTVLYYKRGTGLENTYFQILTSQIQFSSILFKQMPDKTF